MIAHTPAAGHFDFLENFDDMEKCHVDWMVISAQTMASKF